jgi:peroxiredoxin Q/BCP
MAKKKATKKVAKKTSAKKATKKVAKKAVKKVATKKTTKKVTKKVSKKAAKKITKPKVQSAGVVKAPTLQPGDIAPDFTLLDQNNREVSLHDFKGQNVVVYFYPKAMTPGCTVQACELRNSESKLKDADIVVFGISADPVKSLKKFEERDKLNFTLLSDPDHKVISAYGSWGPKSFMGRNFDGILRQSFLIGKDGKIIHVMHKVNTKTHHDDVLTIFKNR